MLRLLIYRKIIEYIILSDIIVLSAALQQKGKLNVAWDPVLNDGSIPALELLGVSVVLSLVSHARYFHTRYVGVALAAAESSGLTTPPLRSCEPMGQQRILSQKLSNPLRPQHRTKNRDNLHVYLFIYFNSSPSFTHSYIKTLQAPQSHACWLNDET